MVLGMLRSATGFALRRRAPTSCVSSNGGRSSPRCSDITRRMYSDGSADDIKTTMASFYANLPWKGTELLFGCIAITLGATYKYNVRGKTILGYRPEEARKEREARKQREEMAKNNIDISLC